MAATRLTPPKSPMVNGKHHSGCMWGLYSLFDFRQADSGRKLIADRKRSNKDLAIENGRAEPSNLPPGPNHDKGLGKDQRNKLKKEETELGRKPSQRLNPRPNLAEKYLEKNNTKTKNKKKKKRKGCGCKNVDFVKYDELSKVDDAAEAIVNQKLSCRDGANPRSRQLLDALDILNSNKELFTKLLQDPDSLLVKHIQELRESQPRKQDSECESSSEIVVLKPGPMTSHQRVSSSSSSSVKADFGFGDIKRKLRQAMGAARKDPSLTTTRESRGAEEVKRKFRNRNDAEKFSCYDAQRSDKIEKLRDFKARIGQEMAKQALRQSPPEDEFSPFQNPGRDANARFSSHSYAQVAYDDWRLAREHKRPSYAGSLKENIEAMIESKKRSNARSQADSSAIIKSASEEACETSNVACHNEASLFEEPCTTNRSSEATDVANNDETEDSASSRLDSCLEDQSSTCSSVFPSTPSTITRLDDRDGSKDIGESSPVSVLEQFFADPCQPDEDRRSSETNLVKPHSDTETNANAHGRISEYVKALLQASGSETRECCQSEKLFSDAENSRPRSSKLCGDCKLIFDCVSDVLVELHEAHHFTHSPWLSLFAPKTAAIRRPLHVEKFATREAMKRVESFFSSSPRSSAERSMEWLIGNDLRRSGAWMDLRSDAEDVVVEIAEDALDDLIMEFVDDLYI